MLADCAPARCLVIEERLAPRTGREPVASSGCLTDTGDHADCPIVELIAGCSKVPDELRATAVRA